MSSIIELIAANMRAANSLSGRPRNELEPKCQPQSACSTERLLMFAILPYRVTNWNRSNGSNCPVRQAVDQWPLFAHSGRSAPTISVHPDLRGRRGLDDCSVNEGLSCVLSADDADGPEAIGGTGCHAARGSRIWRARLMARAVRDEIEHPWRKPRASILEGEPSWGSIHPRRTGVRRRRLPSRRSQRRPTIWRLSSTAALQQTGDA